MAITDHKINNFLKKIVVLKKKLQEKNKQIENLKASNDRLANQIVFKKTEKNTAEIDIDDLFKTSEENF